ncbi:MAG: hypothetical protein JJV98_08930 [Desulfosarcina sp.]|nr:hypothetical protein [Desulfobacterales bacterium]
MPISIKTDRSKDMTLFTVRGTVTLAELTEVLNAYGKTGPTRSELYDMRALEGERLSRDEIDALASYIKRFTPTTRPTDSRTAIVVTEDVDYGIARMIALVTEDEVPFRVEVFRTIEAAEDWIGVNRD